MTEPRGPAEPSELRGLRIDVLRRAVEIYLEHAYPSGQPPEVVRRRLQWVDNVDATKLLTPPSFERVAKSVDGKPPIFALRLGNARYPHMKLQVQPWQNADGFLLSVNTHDQVLSLDPAASDAAAFRELQAENQRLKESIEAAWDGAGLPTFNRYLREYIENRAGSASSPAAAAKPEPS
jgi:hypothetical protein